MCYTRYVPYSGCLSSSHSSSSHVVYGTYHLFMETNVSLGKTMYKNKVSLYSSEDVIEEFYDAIADGDSKRLRRVHIPKSDVFYVREALQVRLGQSFTLDHIERAMYLEGFLQRHEVLDPDRKRPGVG